MKEEERIEALQWFTDFCNLDLGNIGPGDRAKLLIESDCLWPIEELKRYGRPSGRLGPLSEKPEFSWALNIPGKKSPEYWNALVEAQRGLRDVFGSLQRAMVRSPGATDAPSTAPSDIMRGADQVLWWVGRGPGVPFRLEFLALTESQVDYLRLKIFRLLEGFNQRAIRLCPGCNTWFFNPTNREKEFCGNRCIWRTNSAKRRKAAGQQKQKRERAR